MKLCSVLPSSFDARLLAAGEVVDQGDAQEVEYQLHRCTDDAQFAGDFHSLLGGVVFLHHDEG